MSKPKAAKALAAAGIEVKNGSIKKSDVALATTVLAQEAEDWFSKFKNLYSSVAARIEDAPSSAQEKFSRFEDPFKGGFDSLIDYEGEFKDLKTFSASLEERLVKPAKGAVDKAAADHDRMGVLYRLGKAGFKGKFKTGEESGVFNYRGIPVELRLGNENLYLTLPDIYSKDSHGDIIDALAQFLSKVLDSGGAGKTRR